MTYQQKRKATDAELVRACFIKHVPREQIAEAWVDSAGQCELVLHGFIERLTVNVGITEEPA